MSSYFTMPSFARAKKNKEDLEKTNPQEPVLKDEDEQFLHKQISSTDNKPDGNEVTPTVVADDGKTKEVANDEMTTGPGKEDSVIVPETQPSTSNEDAGRNDTAESENTEAAEDPPEEVPTETTTSPKKAKKSKGMELPSQEEAEAATKGFNDQPGQTKESQDQNASADKKTWASYLPAMSKGTKKDGKPNEAEAAEVPDEQKAAQSQGQDGSQRTWAQYASAYVPSTSSLPSMPSMPASWTTKSKDRDAEIEPVYKEDGTIDEEKTKEKQEREVSVLLDNLNMSSINNRVFSFSSDTQKIYERFALVLKDTINGGPTAYEDMDKLMKEAGPKLEAQFKSMPPFVQTLVKSLPAKLGTTLGPELLAAASEKPGNDMKARMEAASKQPGAGADPTINMASTAADDKQGSGKKKRKIPGMKGLTSQQGMVASMLRSTVTFLQTRFPFLASMTNVVMSLAVFILMFVFWYCHKRGKERRLAAESLDGTGKDVVEDGDGELEVEVTDEEEPEEEVEQAGEKDADAPAESEASAESKQAEPLTRNETADEKAVPDSEAKTAETTTS